MDDGAIQRLSERIAVSRAQQASITQAEARREASTGRIGETARVSMTEAKVWRRESSEAKGARREGYAGVERDPASPVPGARRESLVGRILRERKELEAQRANERGRGHD